MSEIAWTGETWNPIVGCSKVSAGCANCYAERMAGRLASMGTAGYVDVVGVSGSGSFSRGWTGKTAFVESQLLKPMKRKKPTLYFVGSMTDLFHESVEDEWLDQVFAVMALCPQHTFQVLTKRPGRMREYFERCGKRKLMFNGFKALPNVWLGVSAENQEMADLRVPDLLRCPAAVRFVSCEPLLGAVDLERVLWDEASSATCEHRVDVLRGGYWCEAPHVLGACSAGLGQAKGGFVNHSDMPGRIDWVICGCESGPGRREIGQTTMYELRRQCRDAGVAFFMKQLNDKWGKVVKDFSQFPVELQVREWPDGCSGDVLTTESTEGTENE